MYKKFYFKNYNFDFETGKLVLNYSLDNKIFFEEVLVFNVSGINKENIDLELLDTVLFNLHLVAGISYWKTYCPSEIVIENNSLTKEQSEFWNNLYTKGLGEFFYKNDINFDNLVNFPYDPDLQIVPNKQKFKNRSIVPIGGGKDSIVSAELLKKKNKDFVLFSVEHYDVIESVSKIVGKELLNVKRTLSPVLFELMKKGCLVGHIPKTGYISFVALVMAVLFDYKNIVLSNEQSASFGNVLYNGHDINHQYSKSLEYEKLFSDYIDVFINPNLVYFSLLRPLYEIKIVEIFSKLRQYFPKFSSCNLANFKINGSTHELWCKKCPKCLFVYICLSAFLSKEELGTIFGSNLYEDKSLLELLLSLIGKTKTKPFECVGTPEEVILGLYLASRKEFYEQDYLIKYCIENNLLDLDNKLGLKETLLGTHHKHNIPLEFLDCLKYEN